MSWIHALSHPASPLTLRKLYEQAVLRKKIKILSNFASFIVKVLQASELDPGRGGRRRNINEYIGSW